MPDKYVWRYQTLQRADHGEQEERDGPVTDLIYNIYNLYNIYNIYNINEALRVTAAVRMGK